MYHKEEIFTIFNKLSLSGIYFLYSKRKKLVYIGQSYDLRNRLSKHYYEFYYFKKQIKRYKPYWALNVKPFRYFRYCLVKLGELDYYESYFINLCKPKYNDKKILFSRSRLEQEELSKKGAKYIV